MALSKKETALVKEVEKKYGSLIDLKKSPAVLIEILRTFGRRALNGTGGVGSVSSVAGSSAAVDPPLREPADEVQLTDILKAVLKLQREVKTIAKEVSQLAGKKGT